MAAALAARDYEAPDRGGVLGWAVSVVASENAIRLGSGPEGTGCGRGGATLPSLPCFRRRCLSLPYSSIY